MSNRQEASDLQTTVAESACRFDESLFISRTDSPEMVRWCLYRPYKTEII